MPYADPERQKRANREAQRRQRQKRGMTLESLSLAVQRASELPEPPPRDVLLRALGVQAVEGSVPAIRLLLEEYRRDGNSDQESKRSKIDELASRRASRAS